MNTRLGSTLYKFGLAGAALSLLYSIDVVWLHTSGKALLPISGRYASREDMLAAISISIALALLSWGIGTAARHFANKFAAPGDEGPHVRSR